MVLGATWAPDVNRLKIACDCGNVFFVRSDRWTVVCPVCSKRDGIGAIRSRYSAENLK